MTGSTSARPPQPGTKTYPNAVHEAASTQWPSQDEKSFLETPLGQRIEPSMDKPGFASAASRAYEKLHGLGPDFGGYPAPPRSRMRRLAMMACVFIVGAGVGLAAAWWFHRPPVGAPLAAIPSTQVHTLPAIPGADGKRVSTIRGISPSELPYDGALPPTATQAPAVSAASQTPPAATDQSSGASGATPQGRSGNDGMSASAGAGEQDQLSSRVEVPAAITPAKVVQEPRDASADDTENPAKAAKQSSASVAGAAPKRKNATRTDREIERIRRQVDEELKRKTDQGRGLGEARAGGGNKGAHASGAGTGSASTSMSRVAANQAMLARCDSKTNFIRRELCRWQVCNGSWGRNGCPSYQKQASAY